MKRFFAIGALVTSIFTPVTPQTPESFFPHHVGDLWQYRYTAFGVLAWTERLDSMFVDTSGIEFVRFNRFYHDGNYTLVGWYGLKDTNCVYEDMIPRIAPDSISKLLYRLDAETGDVWIVDFATFKIAKVAAIDTTSVFGNRVIYKEIWYGYPGPGPSDTSWWDTRIIASGFGLNNAQIEPMGPVYLAGAIIDSVQWGFIVNVPAVELPSGFSLDQNFPNPFNPSTTIRFSLPTRMWVRLKVFDLLGRDLVTLVDGLKQEGTHTVVWNASGYSSGVYFYHLESVEGVVTKKLIFEK